MNKSFKVFAFTLLWVFATLSCIGITFFHGYNLAALSAVALSVMALPVVIDAWREYNKID